MQPAELMQDILSRPPSARWDDHGQLEVLTFDLASETFAVEAMLVREILDLLPETIVPGASPLCWTAGPVLLASSQPS